ncbi:MAG: accessory Sec system translocase SecA2 [Deltaproteobacteria bacterium]|nr:accessory Sec system translocase SecA2 [Deltaproteobacteria bacterium]
MRRFLRSLFSRSTSTEKSQIDLINDRRAVLAKLDDQELKASAGRAGTLVEFVAITAVVAARLLGLGMFDVQLQGALALASGKIAEMQTGEGKTLAAVPAVAWYAKQRQGVHVMTVNDYLARRDASWMRGIYEFLGLSVGCIRQNMPKEERQRAYQCDVTYATANEVGFDYLRDQLALFPSDQVHRPFAAAVIDEADSLLIDEARIPLVIAGGESGQSSLPNMVDRLTRSFRQAHHYTVDEYGRNVALTEAGIQAVESAFACDNLFAENNLALLTAVQDSLHGHAFLRRGIDYLVKDGVVESVDEFKGRIVPDRRWPAGLHTAIESKEGVALKMQGTILGSITLQRLIALYPKVCGMTGTAATQAEEFRAIYGLEVEVIPTNRPIVRIDHPDVLFPTKREKELAVIEEIRRAHRTGQPVLIGTASVAESERLSAYTVDIPHRVLNADNEEAEADIIARAGEADAVTISTNMAGRGTDIRLGRGVAALGGLYVIGTNKHESRRIDNQLRGRAGRQGDPGVSRFFVSLEDDLMIKYGTSDSNSRPDPDHIQRVVEGQNLDIRRLLYQYSGEIEAQRQAVQKYRQDVLSGAIQCSSELERLVSLTTIDELWSEHLAALAELREGVVWVTWGGGNPYIAYLKGAVKLFGRLEERISEEIPKRLSEVRATGIDPSQRSATWTYLTTDQLFDSPNVRFVRGLARIMAARRRSRRKGLT